MPQELICFECNNRKKPCTPCTHNSEILRALNYDENLIEFIQSIPLLGKWCSMEFLLDGAFLHYRGASNYLKHSESHMNQKTEILEIFIEKVLRSQV